MSLQVFEIVRKFRQIEFETQSKSYWYLVNKVNWKYTSCSQKSCFQSKIQGIKKNQKIMPKGMHMDMSKKSYKQHKIKQGKT